MRTLGVRSGTVAAVALLVLGCGATAEAPSSPDTAFGRALLAPDVSVRLEAVRALGGLGAATAPLLVEALWDGDETVRAVAGLELARMGEGAVPALSAAVADPEVANLGRRAAEVLGKMGPRAKEAVPVLVGALRSGDGYMAYRAAGALERIGPAARAAGPALVEALATGRAHVRFRSASALGRIGEASAEPALLGALAADEHEHVRTCSAEALGRLRLASSGPGLVAALGHDPSGRVRTAAATALARLAPTPTATAALADAARADEDPGTRAAASRAIALVLAPATGH